MRRSAPVRAPGILLGIGRIALGRADGITRFGDTREAFLRSLAPLLAFPLVGTALLLANGGGRPAIAQLLATICALLAPPVLSFEFARWWGRRALWARFATALNWCQWLIPVLAVILLAFLPPVFALALPERASVAATLGVVGCYGLWLHWFLARHALALSPARAGALVAVVNLGTAALVLGPAFLGVD